MLKNLMYKIKILYWSQPGKLGLCSSSVRAKVTTMCTSSTAVMQLISGTRKLFYRCIFIGSNANTSTFIRFQHLFCRHCHTLRWSVGLCGALLRCLDLCFWHSNVFGSDASPLMHLLPERVSIQVCLTTTLTYIKEYAVLSNTIQIYLWQRFRL